MDDIDAAGVAFMAMCKTLLGLPHMQVTVICVSLGLALKGPEEERSYHRSILNAAIRGDVDQVMSEAERYNEQFPDAFDNE